MEHLKIKQKANSHMNNLTDLECDDLIIIEKNKYICVPNSVLFMVLIMFILSPAIYQHAS